MYYRCFFCKENAFNAVFFFSILFFTIIKTILFPEELSQISLFLSIFILMLTLLDLFIKALERIIQEQNDDMNNSTYWLSETYNKDDYVIDFYSIPSKKENEFKNYINNLDSILRDQSDKDSLIYYWEIAQVRKSFRKIRKVLLFFYYLLLICIIVFLMFSTNISIICKGVELPDLTIWSFIIILFDLLLSQPVYASVFKLLSKHYNKKAAKLSNKNNTHLVAKGAGNGQAENDE